MSRIQQVKPEYCCQLNRNATAIRRVPSFAGNVAISSDELVKATVEKINGSFESAPSRALKRVCEYLNDKQGEIQTQSLNALFTTTIAPLVIWKNPFYKKDENQKKYFALRQPVSAAIALTAGLGMTIGINNWVDKVANDGMIKSLDNRLEPTKDYLKRSYKAELKAVRDPESLFKAENQKKYLNDIGDISKLSEGQKQKKYLEAYSNMVKDQRKALFTALMGEPKANLKINEETKAVSVLRDGNWIELGRNIPNLTTEKQLSDYIAKNNIHEISFADYLHRTYGFEIYQDGALKGKIKETSMAKLDEIKAMEFLRDTGIAGKNTAFNLSASGEDVAIESIEEENLNLRLGQISDIKTTEKIKVGLKSSALEQNGAEKLSQAIGKSASRAAKFGDGGVHGEKIRLGQLLEQVGHLEQEDKLNEVLNKSAAEVFAMIGKKLEVVVKDAKNVHMNATHLEFASNLLATKIARLSRFGTYKSWIGILTNLGTTIVSCYALNWAYPRFVETFFPSIAKSGEASGEKKGGKA